MWSSAQILAIMLENICTRYTYAHDKSPELFNGSDPLVTPAHILLQEVYMWIIGPKHTISLSVMRCELEI